MDIVALPFDINRIVIAMCNSIIVRKNETTNHYRSFHFWIGMLQKPSARTIWPSKGLGTVESAGEGPQPRSGLGKAKVVGEKTSNRYGMQEDSAKARPSPVT